MTWGYSVKNIVEYQLKQQDFIRVYVIDKTESPFSKSFKPYFSRKYLNFSL